MLVISGNFIGMAHELLPPSTQQNGERGLEEAQAHLRALVLNAVSSAHTRRAYGKALDDLFAFAAGRPLTRDLLLAFRASMEGLSASTVNLRLSAARKLVDEARRSGLLSPEDAGRLGDVPNLRQRGARLGQWLTREQGRELLQVPDRVTMKGKRDYAILAILIGCGLRREEAAQLDLEDIQLREGRWASPTSAARAAGSAPWPSRSGSNMGSMRGRLLRASRKASSSGRSAAADASVLRGWGRGRSEPSLNSVAARSASRA